MNKHWVKGFFLGFLSLYFLFIIMNLMDQSIRYQWDFRTYYHAAKIFAAGQNPYDVNVLEKTSRTGLRWVYPPAVLFFYRPFLAFDYDLAARLFLLLKCGLLIGLIIIWVKEFLKDEADAFFYVFCLLAFNCAIFLDLAAGNISIIEQFLIWLAFYFYLSRRLSLFCIFIVLAATAKMMPIFFLFLLLILDEKKKYVYFSVSVAIFLFYLSAQYIIAPEMFLDFVKGASLTLAEGGIIAPSTLALIRDSLSELTARTGTAVPRLAAPILFSLAVMVIVLISLGACFVSKSVMSQDWEKRMIFLACLVYAIIHPRFKDYSFILLLAPAYFIMKRSSFSRIFPFWFILAVISNIGTPLPGLSSVRSLFWSYYPLLIAYGTWALYLHEFFTSARRQIRKKDFISVSKRDIGSKTSSD